MSPKNAIKVINIQKSYSIQIGSIQSICPLLSNVVLFSSFSPLKFYSVQFDPLSCIQSTLDLFGLHWSYSVHSVHFDLLQSYLSHSVHIGLIRSILFTLVLFGPFYPLLSYSVHISPNWSNPSTSIHYVHFSPIWSMSVLFRPFVLIQPRLVLFGPFVLFGTIWSYLVHLVH